MNNVLTFLSENLNDGLMSWSTQNAAAERFNWSLADIEEAALSNGILPARYQRNRYMLSVVDQLRLFRSQVAVIGCGGLGGYIIEELARLGIGRIVVIDPDVFEEHNLNRQLLSSPVNLGLAKVAVAFARVSQINPAVRVKPIKDTFSTANGRQILQGATLAVDALDSISYRLELAQLCTEMEIPMVHGAIGGWYGHVATQLPGDNTVQNIYRNWVKGKGIEKELGNPSFSPALVASLQVAEVCKLLLGRGELIRNRKLSVDLLDMEIHEIRYDDLTKEISFHH